MEDLPLPNNNINNINDLVKSNYLPQQCIREKYVEQTHYDLKFNMFYELEYLNQQWIQLFIYSSAWPHNRFGYSVPFEIVNTNKLDDIKLDYLVHKRNYEEYLQNYFDNQYKNIDYKYKNYNKWLEIFKTYNDFSKTNIYNENNNWVNIDKDIENKKPIINDNPDEKINDNLKIQKNERFLIDEPFFEINTQFFKSEKTKIERKDITNMLEESDEEDEKGTLNSNNVHEMNKKEINNPHNNKDKIVISNDDEVKKLDLNTDNKNNKENVKIFFENNDHSIDLNIHKNNNILNDNNKNIEEESKTNIENKNDYINTDNERYLNKVDIQKEFENNNFENKTDISNNN